MRAQYSGRHVPLSAAGAGDFTPPEFPGGIPQEARTEPPGVPLGAAAAILIGVLALGLVTVFTVGHTGSGGTTHVSLPGPTAPVHGIAPSASATSTASAPAGTPSTPAGATSTDPVSGGQTGATSTNGSDPYASPPASAYAPEFSVGECVDTSGSGSTYTVTEAGCSKADYKIIYAFQNETGDIDNDMSQCYTINGNDNEFENGDAIDGYTLYCLNSLTGEYSPRRANVDNCLDSTATYEVDCSNSKATWIVIGRLNGTTNTKSCSQFGSYDNSYYWTSAPPFVLCVDKYKH